MLVLIILTLSVAFLFYYFLVKPFSYWRDRGVQQGNPKWLAGDFWDGIARKKTFAEVAEMVYRYPGARYSGMYQFSTPTLVLKDPTLIKQIMVKDFDYFSDHKPFIAESSDPLWGRNLFTLRGQKWRDMRAILTPSFTSSKMKSMFVLIKECAENFVQHFLNKNEDVVTVEFKDIFTRFTNDVIASTAFGIKVDSLRQPNNTFYLMGKEATDLKSLKRNLIIFGYFIFPKLYEIFDIGFFSKKVSKFFTDTVKDTIQVREEQGILRPDMIHLLMEARKECYKQEENDIIDTGFSTAQESYVSLGNSKPPGELSDIDIAAQAMIFFFAGFDTVSGIMCFLAYELAANPDIQDRLRNEIKSTMKECGGNISYEGLLKMKYMDMVVSECLRKWPNIIATDRVCTKPYTIEPVTSDEKPVHLEKGAGIWLPIYAIHHDPKYFPDPERFNPERFSDENKKNIEPYTYFPFGLGPRNCIGSRFALLEIKTVIFQILVNFEIVPIAESKIPVVLSKKQFSLTSDGFWFGLKRLKP